MSSGVGLLASNNIGSNYHGGPSINPGFDMEQPIQVRSINSHRGFYVPVDLQGGYMGAPQVPHRI